MSSCFSDETCNISRKDRIIVAVYNPLSKTMSPVIRLPVDHTDFSVTGPETSTDFEVVKANSADRLKEKVNAASNCLLIHAKEVPPMGMNLYYVTAKKSHKLQNKKIEEPQDLKFGTEDTNFILDDITYKLKSVTMRNVTLNIQQDFYYYQSDNGEHELVASGAYLFRPLSGTSLKKITYKPGVLEYSYKGKIVDEAHIRINNRIKQVIRVYKTETEPHIEFEWMLGPIQVNATSLTGKEIVIRFEVSDLKNKGIFYTDSNGREMILRTKNSRSDYPFDVTDESISSNYYPVTSKILIKDEQKNLEVAVLNDRSQGGTSLTDGIIEIMVHRRLLVDDNKGLGQVLNDSSGVRGKHILVFGHTNETGESTLSVSEKKLQLENLMASYSLVADATAENFALEKIQENLAFQFRFLAKSLPDNVNILSFEKWNNDSFLLRIEHIMEKDENTELSQEVQININELFVQQLTFIKETTLDANQWIEESQTENPGSITLLPMQIRTFILKF